jgi:hypothetical protein
MWTAILGLISNVFKPAVELIDQLHTSDEEKLQAKAAMQVLQNQITSEVLSIQKAEVEASRDIIVAEAQGESWLQRNWRPVLMMLFGVIVANNYILNPWLSAMFGINVTMEIPPDMWALLKLGVGGYVAGRSGEKIIKMWKEK